MRRWKISVLGLLALFAMNFGASASGRDVGNGGDLVICRDGERRIVSAELLDFYEARVLRGIPMDLGAADLSIQSKITLAIGRIRGLSADRYAEYQARVQEFYARAKFFPDVHLEDIPDSDHLVLPQGCAIEQIAIQRAEAAADEPLYVISQELWDALDNDNRAGLVLHEIIYRESILMGRQSSREARYFNSYLCSQRFVTMRFHEFAEVLRAVGYESVLWNGMRVSVEGLTFYPSGVLKTAKVFDPVLDRDNYYVFNGVYFQLAGDISFFEDGNPKKLRFLNSERINLGSIQYTMIREIEFWPSGVVRAGVIKTPDTIESRYYRFRDPNHGTDRPLHGIPFTAYADGQLESVKANGEVLIRGSWLAIGIWETRLYPDGRVQKVYLSQVGEGGDVIRLQVGAVLIPLRRVYRDGVHFFPEGQVQAGTLAAAIVLPLAAGGTRQFDVDSRVEFDRNGLVVRYE